MHYTSTPTPSQSSRGCDGSPSQNVRPSKKKSIYYSKPSSSDKTKKATWVANPVLVPKKDTDVLRMCVDYGPVNKHCPQDHFPLTRIDQIIDSMAGCDLLSF